MSKKLPVHESYALDPVGYARDVLKVTLWAKQIEILRSLLLPPHRTLVLSGHATGKSFVAAVAVSWFFDCHAECLGFTTAPGGRSVGTPPADEATSPRSGHEPHDAARPGHGDCHFLCGLHHSDAGLEC